MESPAPDGPDPYLEACRVDAEALLACVVFAVHNPPPRDPGSALVLEDHDGLEERLRAFMDFDEDGASTGRWRR